MGKIRGIKGHTDEKNEKNLAIIERYCLVSDGDGHDYVIPVHKTADFHCWVDAMENNYETDFDFNDCRIEGGLLTFTDPKVG
jgi:hypothetical protein